PPAAAIVLVGIAAGGMLPRVLQIELTPAALAFFLPALIFEAAWSVDAGALRRTSWAIVVLAVPGVLVTAALIALAGTFGGGLALPAACALGAILSATDPVAVLALFRALSVPTDLLTIVEGESIANDGVALVLAQIAVAASISPTSLAILPAVGRVAYVCAAGIAIGLAVAALGTPLLRRVRIPWIGVATTLVIAYGSYSLASLAGASGIFASAAAGVALPTLAFDKDEVRTIARFWDGTAFVANAVVFLLVGLSLRLDRVFGEPLLFAAVVAAVVASRAILAYAMVPLGRAAGPRPGWRHAIALAGVRGGLSLALALGLPRTFPDRPQLIDAVFAVVFLTIVVQGWTLAPLLRRLNLRDAPQRAPALPLAP
ncbi:MAG: cation:proton antiporter, partial [Candidatus Eremiobacteraeota bacterium]|nr:cation:proton antiporter [Candidatus Eremiobacteraeota bacterium]